jgi:hypothetical protein
LTLQRPDGWSEPVAGDFDGDGRTDVAVHRDDTGAIFVLASTGATFERSRWHRDASTSDGFGWNAGDFTGDGRDDLSAIDPTGRAVVYRSAGSSFVREAWTGAGRVDPDAVVVAGSFNLGAKADVAAFRAADANWLVLWSTGSKFVESDWGGFVRPDGWSGHLVADVNGDGRDDAITRRSDAGAWYVHLSAGNRFTWGGKWLTGVAATPVGAYPGDFTGDGLDDIGFIDEGGHWAVAASTGDGFVVSTWLSPAGG